MSTRGYKCPCCSGSLVFSSDIQKLRCPSCDNEIDMEIIQQYAEIVESVEAQEDTFDWEEDSRGVQGEWAVKEKDGKKVYTCPPAAAMWMLMRLLPPQNVPIVTVR